METQVEDNSFTPSSIGNVLSGSEPEAAPAEKPAAEVEAAAPTESAPEASAAAPAAAPEEVDELEARPAGETVEEFKRHAEGLKKAAMRERKKRQDLEAKLAAQALQQPVAPAPAPMPPPQQSQAPTYFDDPEAYVHNTVSNAITQVSIGFAKKLYPDFDQKYQVFAEAARKNPLLVSQVRNSADPGQEIYSIGKSVAFYQKYGTDPDAIAAGIKAEAEKELAPKLRETWEKEVLGKVEQRKNQPTNILAARSAGGDASPDWKPTTINDVLRLPR